MYAVIRTGGKQYKVAEGDLLRVEKLPAEVGEEIELEDVLLLVDGEKVSVGNPRVEGAKVKAQVRAHGRGPKIRIVKMRRRKHSRTRMGHRQDFTELAITGVSAG
ncbi:MAG: 50S ribosomal protein L21 [Gammaproteobacteria bacterium]|nr:MAG: 50S ribosomal protein L21 [Gammaproteobacteria bacterium]